ncbi:RNA polymerase sigma factor RpoD [Alishewanella longhuensis]
MEQSPESQLKLLILKGKEQGYLTFAEVNDHLPQDIIDSDQIEDIIRMINDMGIQVFESAPDADDLIMSDAAADEDAAEEAAQALVSVDKELGRTTDPVRMYMGEMGTVELLTVKAKLTSPSVLKTVSIRYKPRSPSIRSHHLPAGAMGRNHEAEEIRLSDIVSAFIDPNEIDEAPVMGSNIGSGYTFARRTSGRYP